MDCSYCGKEIPKGRGILLVKKDGKIISFCSSKCEKSFKMKRDPRKQKWTKPGQKAQG